MGTLCASFQSAAPCPPPPYRMSSCYQGEVFTLAACVTMRFPLYFGGETQKCFKWSHTTRIKLLKSQCDGDLQRREVASKASDSPWICGICGAHFWLAPALSLLMFLSCFCEPRDVTEIILLIKCVWRRAGARWCYARWPCAICTQTWRHRRT